MGNTMMVIHRPRKGKERELISFIRDNHPTLQRLGLVTSKDPLLLRAADGAIVEILEWKHGKSSEESQANPEVQELWVKVSRLSSFIKMEELKEFRQIFPEFETID